MAWMLWDCVVEEQRDDDGLWIHGFVFCPFQIHLFCLLWTCSLKQETTKLRKLIAGVCCLPKSGCQSGNAGLGQWSCKWKNWHYYTICKCCRVSPSSVSLSYLQWTVDIVDYNSSFKFNRIVRLLMKVVPMKCDFFPEDDRYHDSSPLIDRDLSRCKMCWFKGIYQYNQNEKFLCFSGGVDHRYINGLVKKGGKIYEETQVIEGWGDKSHHRRRIPSDCQCIGYRYKFSHQPWPVDSCLTDSKAYLCYRP